MQYLLIPKMYCTMALQSYLWDSCGWAPKIGLKPCAIRHYHAYIRSLANYNLAYLWKTIKILTQNSRLPQFCRCSSASSSCLHISHSSAISRSFHFPAKTKTRLWQYGHAIDLCRCLVVSLLACRYQRRTQEFEEEEPMVGIYLCFN